MTSEEFQKITKLLIMDGYKNVVMYVHQLELGKVSRSVSELLEENERLYKRVNELLKEISVLKKDKPRL